MATVELKYDINPGIRPRNAAEIIRIAGIPIFRGELDQLGMVVAGDVTTLEGTQIRRTVTLQTEALGDSLFPTEAALKSATLGLYKATLNLLYPGSVVEHEPVVTL